MIFSLFFVRDTHHHKKFVPLLIDLTGRSLGDLQAIEPLGLDKLWDLIQND